MAIEQFANAYRHYTWQIYGNDVYLWSIVKEMKKIVLLFTAAVLLIACSRQGQGPEQAQEGEPYVIEGQVTGLPGKGIIEVHDAWDGWTPKESGANEWKVLNEAKVKDGHFRIEGKVKEPTHVYLYYSYIKGLHVGMMQVRDFFLEPGTITVVGDADADEGQGATGTPLNDAKAAARGKLNAAGPEEYLETLSELVGRGDALALYMIEHEGLETLPGEQLLQGLDALPAALQEMDLAKQLRERIVKYALTSPSKEASGENPPYIDIELPDPEGNALSLKSVVEKPGTKYVLIDFWATWCGPCREEIPGLVALYKDFHAKGFDIYSVSVDSKPDQWRNFVKDSEMTWHHVCDGKYVKTQAYQDYAVDGIPETILVDASTGRIIARGLRSAALREKLSQLL